MRAVSFATDLMTCSMRCERKAFPLCSSAIIVLKPIRGRELQQGGCGGWGRRLEAYGLEYLEACENKGKTMQAMAAEGHNIPEGN